MLTFIWTEFFYRPLYNLVVLTYNFTPGPNLGWAIITLAVFIRLLFLYFSIKGYKTDAILESLAPQLKAVENDQSLTARQRRDKITAILKGKAIDPMAEIWAVLAQVLFLIGLYQVIQVGFGEGQTNLLYAFVHHPATFNTNFFGFELVHPNVLLSLIAAFILFLELVLEYNLKKDIPRTTISEKWFPFLLPFFTFLLLVILPATKALFIITSVVFSLILRGVITLALRSRKKYV